MTKKSKRNLIGSTLCFLSCCLLGGIAIAFWMWREVWQSDKYGFEVEKDDIKRYSLIGAVGAMFNVLEIYLLTR